MRLFYTLAIVILTIAVSANTNSINPITQDLVAFLNQKQDNELIRVNIRLKDQLNKMDQYKHLQTLSAAQRRNVVVNDLKDFHSASQAELMNFLNQKPATSFKLVRTYWIANVITAYLDEATIQELAVRSDIVRIDIDEKRQVLESLNPKPKFPDTKSPNEIVYNVLQVNAPQVWDLGYTGEGVIVSVIDAGINYNHVDLANQMWQSDEYPLHGYDFYNNDNDPMDGHGHGTHCAGTVAGNGTAGSQTGMAPNATLMACKVLADGGDGFESAVWAAIEFSVEQGAHVISMSLGWQHSWNPDRTTWRQTYDNALAAGVIAAVAAGNEGGSVNNPDDVRTPGDCPPPWLHPDQTLEGGVSAVVSVGATDANDNIASFSSRGPSDWSNVEPFFDYPFNPEMGLIRPDVSAPGVNVKSCNAFNINGYTNMSGTSMATPGVAGVMALLLSKNPGLSPEELCMILETTAVDKGASGKDNVFGSGRIDALEAIENTSEQGPVYESHSFTDDNANGELEAGETILITLTMYNGSDMDFTNVEVILSTDYPFISFADDFEIYGDFAVGQSVTVEDAFAFQIAADMPGNQDIRFNVTATDGNEVWESKFNVLSYGPNIHIGELSIDDSQGNSNGRLDPGEQVVLQIELNNTGQSDISNLDLNISEIGPLLNFSNTAVNIEQLPSNQPEVALFDVTVSTEAQIGQKEFFTADLTGGNYADTKVFSTTIGLTIEDWETGDFEAFDWSFAGGDWFITDLNPYEGEFCSQSADIGDNQSTSLIIEYNATVDGVMSFYKKVDSENNYDFLRFFIDEQEMGSWSGNVSWSYEEYEVSAGMHTFKWEYDKDGLISSGADAAWVDFIVFPYIPLPNINIPIEATICEGETYTSEAVVEDFVSLEWSTSGDGSFDDMTIQGATYTPGIEDITNGMVDLSLTAYGDYGMSQSTLTLYIYPIAIDAPEMPTGNTDLCINPEDQSYHTNLLDAHSLNWMLEPTEAGQLMANGDSVVVEWAEDFVGEAQLSVMTANMCAESAYSEALTIIVNDLPVLSMQADFEACYGEEFVLEGELSGTAPWTVNIEGFGDVVVEDSPMSMSWTAEKDSSMTINWLKDAHMCLNEATHIMNLSVKESPMVILSDSSICMNHEILLDAGNEGAVFEWSTGETTQTITIDSSGMNDNQQKEIWVRVTNSLDCTSEATSLISFEDCSGLGDIALSEWDIYPNPTKGFVELKLNSEKNQTIQLQVISLGGQIVYSESIFLVPGANNHALDLSFLSAEAYLVLLKSNSGQLTYRIVIEK